MKKGTEESVKQATPPSKEEIISFLSDQIEVKAKQFELQDLNTKLAMARAEELKALTIIAQITNPRTDEKPSGTVEHIVTQEDLDANPELVDAGVIVGDPILIPEDDSINTEAKRSLKK
jgi:hypothetical protein